MPGDGLYFVCCTIGLLNQAIIHSSGRQASLGEQTMNIQHNFILSTTLFTIHEVKKSSTWGNSMLQEGGIIVAN